MPEKLGEKIRLFFLLVSLVSLVIAVYGYWFVPLKNSLNPKNVIFHSKEGNVLFSHYFHYNGDGAGIECNNCHHNCDSGFQKCEMNCRNCHYKKDYIGKCKDSHSRCIGKQCTNCHEGESCSFCHRRKR